MSSEALYTARRTMVTRKFVWCLFIFVLGVIGLIGGFVLLKSSPILLYVGLILMVVSAIFILCEALVMRSNTIEFYEKKYVIRSGFINKHESEVILTNLVSVSVSQSLGGRMLDYGTVKINVVGKQDISLSGVKHPQELKKYIEKLMEKTEIKNINQVIHD